MALVQKGTPLIAGRSYTLHCQVTYNLDYVDHVDDDAFDSANAAVIDDDDDDGDDDGDDDDDDDDDDDAPSNQIIGSRPPPQVLWTIGRRGLSQETSKVKESP